MSKVIVSKEKLIAIADAIREKTDTTDTYELDDMPDLIRNTSGGGDGYTILELGIVNDTILGLDIIILEDYVILTDQNIIS